MPLHPAIEAFEAGAELLDLQDSPARLDDAIAQLAAWMALAGEHLSEDDLIVLTAIGAMLYREGLRSRR